MNMPDRSIIHQWVHAPISAPIRAALSRLQNTESVRHIALMPDVHLAHDICVGTVVATDGSVFPQAVGGDIGCGMAIAAFAGESEVLENETVAAHLMAALYESVPTIRHRRRLAPSIPAALEQSELSNDHLKAAAHCDGRSQLGTLGRGNHFLEFQSDGNGQLWLMVHSGSRGMGERISAYHLSKAERANTGIKYFDVTTEAGQAYINDMDWAVQYAAANRSSMVEAAANALRNLFNISMIESTALDVPHNYVRRENHFGQELWVHRKGAISAKEGEPGIIPGSMGTASFHVEGRGHPDALQSSSHGAGRTLSRSDARRRIARRELENQMRNIWFDHRISSRLCEEAPAAYKDIEKVMRAQKDLTRVVRRLRPLLCYKGV